MQKENQAAGKLSCTLFKFKNLSIITKTNNDAFKIGICNSG